jgi:tetratricopeptide (TPR) repeat protein
MHLPEETFSAIVALINKAKIEIDRKGYDKAWTIYQKAEAAFPQPIESYTGACFLFYSMAQLLLLQQKEAVANDYNARALECLDGFNDAKVWYQAGLVHLRMGNAGAAKEDLTKAYALGGKAVFTDARPDETAFFKEHIYPATTTDTA